MVLHHSGKYYKPMWTNRGNNKIMVSFDGRFMSVINPIIKESHFTYPEDGDFHYTFYTDTTKKSGIRQFCDRIQYLKNGEVIRVIKRTRENEVFNMQPLFEKDWAKLPLKDIKESMLISLPLPIFGFGLPFANSMARNIFTKNKPRYKKNEFLDISSPDKGTFNCHFVLRGKASKASSGEKIRFIVEDMTHEPIISLVLVHLLSLDHSKRS